MGLSLCLFGPDGSGKTTIARHVATYLHFHGINATIVWMRGTHTLASVFARFLAHFSSFQGSCNPYYYVCIPSKMKRLWLWIELISILPIILLRFIIPKLLGRVIIAERSFIDFLVWLIITLRYSSVVRGFVGRVIVSFAYSLCDKGIYIRADLDTLVARREGSDEEHLIPAQLQIYDAIAKALKTPCIDTSGKSISKTIREVLRIASLKRIERH